MALLSLAPLSTLGGCNDSTAAPEVTPPTTPTDAAADTYDDDVDAGSESTGSVETIVEEPESPPPAPTVQIEDGMALLPAGEVLAGSAPGTVGRVARAEAPQIPVSIPAFRIDVRPHTETDGAASVHVSAQQAGAQCAAEGKRLCTELEWERACEGPANHAFAGGEEYRPEATSAYGVVGLGATGEWTSSSAPDLAPSASVATVFRGAASDQEAPLHRCNARRGTDASTQSRHITYRCCQSVGEEESPTYPTVETFARFRPLGLGRDRVREILRSVPEVAMYAEHFEPMAPDRSLGLLGDDPAAALGGWEVASPSFSWSPAPGEHLWVLTGSVDGRALLVALYVLPGDELQHATSMLFEEEADALVVAFTPPERHMLKWSTHWGYSAESGALVLGEDSVIRFETR